MAYAYFKCRPCDKWFEFDLESLEITPTIERAVPQKWRAARSLCNECAFPELHPNRKERQCR